jgi:predicted transcriptional regulator
MEDIELTNRALTLSNIKDTGQLRLVLKALDSDNRLRILDYLSNKVATLSEIAAVMELPISTTALHIDTLKEAGLISIQHKPSTRGGIQKVCARMYDRIEVRLPVVKPEREQSVELYMPIGKFIDCQVTPTCGLLTDTHIIGFLDDPASFYEPETANASLLWFHQGYVEYRFPNRLPANTTAKSLRLSMEICSEAPLYNLDWPSDITLWINGVEVGTWTSPADFGGEPGRLTPAWWTRGTQYGLLKFWHVSEQLSEVDGMQISAVNIHDLKLKKSPFISIRIGVKADAQHVGGLNLFGSKFGNYPQDLVLSLGYRTLGN